MSSSANTVRSEELTRSLSGAPSSPSDAREYHSVKEEASGSG
jgi:hypothetical protein